MVLVHPAEDSANRQPSALYVIPHPYCLEWPNRLDYGVLRGRANAVTKTVKPKTKTAESEVDKDKTFLLSAPEISVFVACCVMVNELRGFERAFQNGDITRSAFDEKSKAVLHRLTEAAEATQRFDVVFPVMESGRFSPFFWRWFNWWDDYLKALTPSQVVATERRARESASSIDDLRPKNNWLVYRSTPAIEIEVP